MITAWLVCCRISARMKASKDCGLSTDFLAVRCSIYIFENQNPTPAHVFSECASKYTVTGKTLGDICDHNASVAWTVGRPHIATIWRMIKLLFGGACSSGVEVGGSSGASGVNMGRLSAVLPANSRDDSETSPGDFVKDSRPGTRHQSGNTGSAVEPVSSAGGVSGAANGTNGLASNERGDTSGGVSEDAESEVDDIDSHVGRFSYFITTSKIL